MNDPMVIAEIGCNHTGDMDIARELISTAKIFCKAHAVKFQKRDIATWTDRKPQQYKAAHPNPVHAYGNTYREHRENLEFSREQHRELKAFCDDMDILYSCSVWDLPSAKDIASLSPKFIKIPSACNMDFPMLTWLCTEYEGEIHISTGMTTKEEIEQIVQFLENHDRAKDTVLYNCTSGYPVPFEDVALLEIENLIEAYGERIKDIGFSGHHLGIAVDIAAYTLGAEIIERHYTLDRTWRGTDHAASLEPDGVRRLVRDLTAVHKALAYKSEDVLPIEQEQRNKLKHLTK
ncbi:N-acetylneuraminate synthase family protein [Chitinivibrio alkaliphilus]|uniref:N-acetylneuraminic acid phosphate synthase n=1 Tax=Chitinivibrio alkaliphilus ACht1 TaxID=1313304 RepID=U7DCE1_9BACT|nr:N-acetylneuraminate synthase family protein [Chitinivibrio alkaliphilus]ERP32095.1 N-acetylneuraminic acid phosphate synthase [Chitinivibrio alkaliphilus ACht1]